MKYILEIKPEYENSFKGVMLLGAKDSNLFVDTLAVDNLEELNSDYINEHYGSLQDEAYQRGLEDGKAQAERGCKGCKYEWVEKDEEPCAHCANCYINHWTAKDDKIVVGDEVETKDGKRFVVTTFGSGFDGDIAVGVCADGLGLGVDLKELRKTGRHFDIGKILEEMRT